MVAAAETIVIAIVRRIMFCIISVVLAAATAGSNLQDMGILFHRFHVPVASGR